MIGTLILVRLIISFTNAKFFQNHKTMKEEPVQGATIIIKIFRKRYMKLPVEGGTLIQAYGLPTFSAYILSIAFLIDYYDVCSRNRSKITLAVSLFARKPSKSSHNILFQEDHSLSICLVLLENCTTAILGQRSMTNAIESSVT